MAHAEWMQGFFVVSCAPEVGLFSVTPAWISAPDQIYTKEDKPKLDPEMKKTLDSHGLKLLGVDFNYKCENTAGNVVELIGHNDSPFFDIYMNGKKYIDSISMRDDFPIYLNGGDKIYRIEFLEFTLNGTLWSFKAFVRKDTEYQRYSGDVVHIWGDAKDSKKEILINNDYIGSMYANKPK